MAKTLGQGSKHPDAARTSDAAARGQVTDYTVAGVATRVKSGTPTDADWGNDPPPNGTIVVDDSGTKIWVRLGNTWKGVSVS